MRSCCVRDSCGVAGRAWHSAACGNIPRVAWMSACGRAASVLTLARRAVCGLKRCGDVCVCDPMSARGRAASEIAVAWPVVRGTVLRVGTSRAWPGCLRAAVMRPG